MTERTLWLRFTALLMLSVVVIFLIGGCATIEKLDNTPFVKAMSSDQAAIGCQAADAITTYVVLSKFATLSEANPLMSGILKTGGWPLFFAVKILMAIYMTSDNINPTAAAAINTATCGVAISNIAVGVGALPK